MKLATTPGTPDASPRDYAEQRNGPDRRTHHPLLSHWRWAFQGRRANIRRFSDLNRTTSMVDRFGPSLLAVLLTLFGLSMLDAWFTMMLLNSGLAIEANPLMAWMLSHGVSTFVGAKVLMSAVGVIALAGFSNTLFLNRIPIQDVATYLCVFYAAVVFSQWVALTY